jgi:hypothetical protein
MAKMGRPKKEIHQEEFEKLCALQCTEEEICNWFGVTDKTLCSWCKRTYKKTFSEIFKEKRSKGKVSLRRTQFKLAQKSPAMAIFLGKQYLGQTDKVEQVNTDNDNVLKFIEGMKNNGNKAN